MDKNINLDSELPIKVAAEEPKRVTVKPVANAIRIIRYLNETDKPQRSADIARQLAINTSTCFNILRTLVDEGLLDFNNTGKTYSVGLGMFKLVKSNLADGQRLQAARYIMEELAAQYRVTITLWKRVAKRIVLVSAEASPAGLSIAMSEGQRLPVLMGASGRVFASHTGLTKQQSEADFKKIRWAQDFSFDDYWQQVDAAKQQGWAVDKGFFSNGITTVAVPIYNLNNEVLFTLSAVMVNGAIGDDSFTAFIVALQEGSQRVSACLF